MASTKNFAAHELQCSCCGAQGVSQEALDKLQAVRTLYGAPLRITSAYRCENHPNEATKSTPGSHNKGVAFDIAVTSGAQAARIIKLGIQCECTGFALGRGFVHLDWREGQSVTWRY